MRIESVNEALIDRTNARLQREIAPHVGLVGSARYNLTLINRMEPTSAKKDLKQEKIYNMGKTSVSWHKDSGLQDFSSIAVYHSLQEYGGHGGHGGAGYSSDDDHSKNKSWRVAVRVASANSKTPAQHIASRERVRVPGNIFETSARAFVQSWSSLTIRRCLEFLPLRNGSNL